MKKPTGPCEFKYSGSLEYYLGGYIKIIYNGDSI